MGTGYRSDFTLLDVESKRGIDLLDDQFGGQGAGQVGNIVFAADDGVEDPEVRRVIEPFLADVAGIEGVQSLESPYSPGNEGQIASEGEDAGGSPTPSSRPRRTRVRRDGDHRCQDPCRDAVSRGRADRAGWAGVRPVRSAVVGGPRSGVPVIILIIAFGSVLAMGLPIGVALAGIVSGSILTGLLSQVVDMPNFTSTIGVMIGLGVGIDYALFIVTRFRENLHKGHGIEESTLIAMNTAGRAVVFAGSTVVISLLGLLIMQLSFVSGMAIGMAVVALTLLASLTLLPALLGYAGDRIEAHRRRLIAAVLIAVAFIGVGLGIPALLSSRFPSRWWCSWRASPFPRCVSRYSNGSAGRCARPCRTGGAA